MTRTTTEKTEAAESPVLDLGASAAYMGPRLFILAAAVFLAATIFEAVAANSFRAADLAAAIESVAIGANVDQAGHYLAWRAAALMLLGTIIGAIALAGTNVRAALIQNRRATLLLIGNAVALGIAIMLVYSSLSEPTSYLKALAALFASRDPMLEERGFVALVTAPKRVAEILAGLVAIGMTTVLILPAQIDAQVLRERIKRLRLMLYASATMLIVGVAATRASYAFVLSFGKLANDDSGSLSTLVAGGVAIAAAFYTLVLAAGYLPAALILSRLSERLAQQAQRDGLVASENDFLAENALRFSWKGQLGRILAISSPLLSAVLPGLSALSSK